MAGAVAGKRPEEAGERRYDSTTVSRALALAQRLEAAQRESYTLSEVECLGREVGLAPELVWDALTQVTAPDPALLRRERSQELRVLQRLLTFDAVWGILLFALAAWYREAQEGALLLSVLGGLLAVILPAVAAVGQGYLLGRRWPAAAAAAWLIFCLAPGVGWWLWATGSDQLGSWLGAFGYLSGGGIVAAALGVLGAAAGEYYRPRPEWVGASSLAPEEMCE